MAIIGKRNSLVVMREMSSGLYLDGGEQGDILLPGRYIPRDTRPGDRLDVFVYLDSEDRLVATTEKPFAEVGDFATLKVISVNPRIGAFLDWGLSKDLLLPFREQDGPVRVGQQVVVFIYLDEKSNRIVATARVHRHLSKIHPPFVSGDAVEILITGRTPLGYNVIVERTYRGLLYQNYQSGFSIPLDTGAVMPAFVRTVRPDGKIDVSLDATGAKRVAAVRSLKDRIIDEITNNGGTLDFDDDSSPDQIRTTFGSSKKAFKQALGALYKERLIEFGNPGIRLPKK